MGARVDPADALGAHKVARPDGTERLLETAEKYKGKKVFKTTKVKDQYGRTVYKNTTSHKKKKKK